MTMALFGLALRLGKTVKELEAQIDSKELVEWCVYLKLDPDESDKITDPVTMEHAFKTYAKTHNSRLEGRLK